MNINSYESEYYKQANHNLLALWKIIAMVLFIAYIGEFLKGNRTFSYLCIFTVFTFLPLVITSIFNKKTNYDSKKVKYIGINGYLLFYIFVLFTTVSSIAWVYIIPMASILVVYNDKKIMRYTYGGAIFINLIYIARLIAIGNNLPLDITNYEIQMACLILSGMFLYKTMDLNIFANNKVKTEIENSLHDPLTQSYNRNFIFEYFNKITLKSLTDTGVSFILIDIDNFKKLNDTKGHDFGDKVLVTLCQAVNNILKQYDDAYLIRMGGDEFAIVSTNFTKENSLKLVNKIKTDFNNLFIEKMIDVTFSIGISNSLIDNCNSYIELYNLADKRLYNSKNNGKNMATYN